MRSLAIGQLLAVAVLLLPVSVARSGASDESELKEEFVIRCLHDMGEFGVDAVGACVEQDWMAAKALEQYPAGVGQIVARCTQQLRRRGWSMVKVCADRDIEAAAALAGYAKEHKALVERCQAHLAEWGAARVKDCVDQELEVLHSNDPRRD